MVDGRLIEAPDDWDENYERLGVKSLGRLGRNCPASALLLCTR
jgi:hypothetical protein